LGHSRISRAAGRAVEVAMWCHVLLVPLAIAGLLAFLPWTAALPRAMGLAMSTALVVYAARWAMRRPVVTGAQGLRGSCGEAGLVRLRDALRLAGAWKPFAKGQAFEVMDVVGVRVRVRPWT
jgi:hypothetical protein